MVQQSLGSRSGQSLWRFGHFGIAFKECKGEIIEVWFCISGSVVAKSETGIVPTIGSEVTIQMDTYKKGLEVGTVLTFTVNDEFPPHYDYTAGVVYVDVNGWQVHKPREELDD